MTHFKKPVDTLVDREDPYPARLLPLLSTAQLSTEKKENHITGPDEHIEKRLLAQLTRPVDTHAETGLLPLKAFYCLEAAILSSFFLHLSPNHQLERKKICVTMKWVLSP